MAKREARIELFMWNDVPDTELPIIVGERTRPRAGWGFRLRAANGRLVMTAGESFTSRANALRAVNRVIELVSGKVEIVGV